jgi:hypothetical protein
MLVYRPNGSGGAYVGSAFSARRGWRKALGTSMPADLDLGGKTYLMHPSRALIVRLGHCSGFDTLLRF